MDAKLRVCDFCWNDDAKIVIAMSSYMCDAGDEIDVCTKHTKLVKEAGLELQAIEQPELPYW